MALSVRENCLVCYGNDSSCSGLVLNAEKGLIITHSLLLLPLFVEKQNPQLCLDNLKEYTTVITDIYNKDIFAKVVFEIDFDYSTLQNRLNKVSNKSKSSKQVTEVKAKVTSIVKATEFEKVLRKLFPNHENWSFSKPDDEKNANELTARLLPYFTLLTLNTAVKCQSTELCMSKELHIGQRLRAVATPFGSLCPPVFLNSHSEGIICNTSGVVNSLILTDARCIPGCEGGAVYTNNGLLAGLVVAPLCWKANEWVGYTLVCSMQEIIESLLHVEHLLKTLHTKENVADEKSHFAARFHLQNVVYIQTPFSWGSGFVLDTEKGIVLTCGHVVNNVDKCKFRQMSNVNLGQMSYPVAGGHTDWLEDLHTCDIGVVVSRRYKWFTGSVLYSAPNQKAFDVAVIKLKEPFLEELKPVKVTDCIRNGQRALVAGFGVFDKSCGLSASVTQGVVSKVVKVKRTTALIQSSCAVHAGASGGALMTEDGSFVGLVVCNVKDHSSNSLYPHVNFSIPLKPVMTCVNKYMHSDDISYLRQLHQQDKVVQKIWSLDIKDFPLDSVTCKL